MAVANLGSDAGAVIPDSMLIDFPDVVKGASGSNVVFEKMAEYLDAQVSRGILGQTATTQGTQLGNEDAQAEVREDIRDDDAAQLAETINRDLVRPYIDLNYGVQEQYPQVVLRAVENEDIAGLTTALKELIPCGLKVEQKEIRDKLGLKDPEPGAELLMAPAQGNTTNDAGQEEPALQSSGKALNRATNDGLEELLFAYARTHSEEAATAFLHDAQALLDDVNSLEAFKERLVDLFHNSNPELLAEVFARVELMSHLAGRMEAADES
ncbi:MAG: hypothetical protein CSA34_00440 [Desulfobulbus propionicus]|nr:MAG: hypothetical protein CSA34_00440 [Desulfobulbus propionicus]